MHVQYRKETVRALEPVGLNILQKLTWWFYTDITICLLPSVAVFILIDTFCIIRME